MLDSIGTARLPLGGADWLNAIRRHAFNRGEEPALRFEGRPISWSQLIQRVDAGAAVLQAGGVERGDRVLVLLTNRPEFAEAVLAANALGAIAVPVNFRLAPAELAYIIEDSGCRIIVTEPDLLDLAVGATGERQVPVLVTGLATDLGGRGEEVRSYEEELAATQGRNAAFEDPSIEERDVALICYTSGTTGRPKGAMLTHLNLLMETFNMLGLSRHVGEDQVGMVTVPLFHIAGVASLAANLIAGIPTVIQPTRPFKVEDVLHLVDSDQVTSLFLVPAQWQLVCAHPDAGRSGSSLRTISWGAAPASIDLLETMGRTFPGVDIVSTFGQTEMSPVTAFLPPEDAIRKIGSVGRPIPAIAWRIVDDDMRDVPQGEIGEIVYRGPTLMAGYWNKPEATAEAFRGGWFHSGDMVRMDSDGYLWVADRKKDMIISGGENIYCVEVEQALSGHPKVADLAVVGQPHPKWGETPVAVVVAVDQADPPTLEELVGWSRDRLASYKKPTVLELRAELPRNASGKVLKHLLREELSLSGSQ